MSRKDARTHAFKIIFQLPFHSEITFSEAYESYLSCFWEAEAEKHSEKDLTYIKLITEGVFDKLTELDKHIEENAISWSLNRIASADLAILRLAIFEMLYVDDIHAKVSINEAVELAKEYGTDDSFSFINGILGSICAKLGLDTEQ